MMRTKHVLKQLWQDCVILKSDKDNAIILINKIEHNLAMKKLFSDHSKFKDIKEDTTLTWLVTVQNYTNTMFKRYEIFEEQKKQKRPMAVQLERAYRLPKMRNVYANLHSF